MYIYEVLLKNQLAYLTYLIIEFKELYIHFRYKIIFSSLFLAFPSLKSSYCLTLKFISLFRCLYFCVLFKTFCLYQGCKDFVLRFLQEVFEFYLDICSILRFLYERRTMVCFLTAIFSPSTMCVYFGVF